jgi:hypothetical protein
MDGSNTWKGNDYLSQVLRRKKEMVEITTNMDLHLSTNTNGGNHHPHKQIKNKNKS